MQNAPCTSISRLSHISLIPPFCTEHYLTDLSLGLLTFFGNKVLHQLLWRLSLENYLNFEIQ